MKEQNYYYVIDVSHLGIFYIRVDIDGIQYVHKSEATRFKSQEKARKIQLYYLDIQCPNSSIKHISFLI